MLYTRPAGRVETTVERRASFERARFVADGTLVMTVSPVRLEFFNVATGEQVGEIRLSTVQRTVPALSTNGRFLVVDAQKVDIGNVLEVWDLKHLNQIISGLRRMSVVSRVARNFG